MADLSLSVTQLQALHTLLLLQGSHLSDDLKSLPACLQAQLALNSSAPSFPTPSPSPERLPRTSSISLARARLRSPGLLSQPRTTCEVGIQVADSDLAPENFSRPPSPASTSDYGAGSELGGEGQGLRDDAGAANYAPDTGANSRNHNNYNNYDAHNTSNSTHNYAQDSLTQGALPKALDQGKAKDGALLGHPFYYGPQEDPGLANKNPFPSDQHREDSADPDSLLEALLDELLNDRELDDRKLDDRKLDDRKLGECEWDDREWDDSEWDDSERDNSEPSERDNRERDNRERDDRKWDDRKWDDHEWDDRELDDRELDDRERDDCELDDPDFDTRQACDSHQKEDAIFLSDLDPLILSLSEEEQRGPLVNSTAGQPGSRTDPVSSHFATAHEDPASRKRRRLRESLGEEVPARVAVPGVADARPDCNRNGASASRKRLRVNHRTNLASGKRGEEEEEDTGQQFLYEASLHPRAPPKEVTDASLGLMLRLTGGAGWGTDVWAEDILRIVACVDWEEASGALSSYSLLHLAQRCSRAEKIDTGATFVRMMCELFLAAKVNR
ncbi:AAA family [Lentinula edodes]|uniref:AAA family n=1 Tax=Lentinula edodes TaxID=5353 RepID=A0A1Q3ER59_LENED|nr:AAA family [Lentinula edodes]